MTCKLLALATVAFHLAWSTLTLLGVESASAQTTPSPSLTPSPSPSTTPTPTPESTPSPSPRDKGEAPPKADQPIVMPQKEKEETASPKSERALPMPEPESTLSQATLGSGPDVVITYEGELVEFPRYQKGGYYVVEIPEARRSRLIRGDLSVCASKNGVTVWSFPNRPGTQTILRHVLGRIEIILALDARTPPKADQPIVMPQKEKEETAPPKSERALPMPEP